MRPSASLLLHAAASCGGAANVCVPGQQVACACPGGDPGAQTCAADGASFSTCACGSGGGAGGAGAGGGGAAGAGGGGQATGGGGQAGGAGAGGGGAGGAGPCGLGDLQSCYTGPAGTSGIGVCHDGSSTCQPNGSWGPCVGQVTPAPTDSCQTPDDDDCSGSPMPCSNTTYATLIAPEYSVMSLAVGDDDSVYVTVDAGPVVLNGMPYQGILAVKLDPAGSVVWARKLPGNGGARAAASPSGDVFVLGSFSGAASIGGNVVMSDGAWDLHVLRLDASTGQTLDDIAIQGGGDSLNGALAVFPDGDLLVTGLYWGQLTFGATLLTSGSPAYDSYVARLAPDLTTIWAESAANVRVGGAAVLPSGDVALGGCGYVSPALVGGLSQAVQGQDLVVARLAGATGAGHWVHGYGSSGDECELAAVAVTPEEAITFVGHLANGGAADFGDGVYQSAAPSSPFVVRLDGSGAPVFSAFYPTLVGGGNQPKALATGKDGRAYFGGDLQSTVDFGLGSMSPTGGSDAFLVRLAPSGATLAAAKYGDANNQVTWALGVDSLGLPIVGLQVQGTVDVGQGPLTVPNGDTGALIARLAP